MEKCTAVTSKGIRRKQQALGMYHISAHALTLISTEGDRYRMKKVSIKRNPLGDTRTATKVPTIFEFDNANDAHIYHVSNMMKNIADDIYQRGRGHDETKRSEPERSVFYRELCAKIEGKIDSFTDGEWYPMHCQRERHHLNDRCPDDVNLIDVLEMICDCVCAGMARKGNVYPVTISSEILQKAVENTTNMCIEAVEMIE